jgi:hypothetical protein
LDTEHCIYCGDEGVDSGFERKIGGGFDGVALAGFMGD